jgi:hypothetical protein
MGKNNQRNKERRIRILDPKRVDYTHTGQENTSNYQPPLDNCKNSRFK